MWGFSLIPTYVVPRLGCRAGLIVKRTINRRTEIARHAPNLCHVGLHIAVNHFGSVKRSGPRGIADLLFNAAQQAA